MKNILKTLPIVLAAGLSLIAIDKAQAQTTSWLDVINARYGHDDCRLLPLTTWHHPTRDVMEKAGVDLHFVALCQNDTYPVFGVDFRYDPRTATDDYFHPLYDAMHRANGGWSFSFLVVQDRLTIDVSGKGATRHIAIEDLPAP